MHRLRAPRPLLERPEGRSAEGEQGHRAEIARQRFDHPPAPAVERMVEPVAAPRRSPANAPHPSRPAMPASTIVRTSARRAAPLARRRGGSAPRGTRPVRAMAESTVSSPPLMRIVSHLAVTRHPSCTHVGDISLDTNHLASSLLRAQNSQARARAAKRRRLSLDAAYSEISEGVFRASPLTRGPWHPDHQHAGPPSALICRAIERAAAERPDASRAAHRQSAAAGADRRLPRRSRRRTTSAATPATIPAGSIAGGKEIARFTALMQREDDLPIPEGTPGHPPPRAPKAWRRKSVGQLSFPGRARSATLTWSRTGSRRASSSTDPAPPGFA